MTIQQKDFFKKIKKYKRKDFEFDSKLKLWISKDNKIKLSDADLYLAFYSDIDPEDKNYDKLISLIENN